MMMHAETLEPGTDRLITHFGDSLARPGFMLCGGTALALRLGHRQSEDLDFLTPSEFGEAELASFLQSLPESVSIDDLTVGTVNATVGGVKVQYLHQRGVAMEADTEFGAIPVASLDTLTALKCNAVATRAAKKDFMDCFALCQNGASLEDLLVTAKRLAPALNVRHALNSFTYFDLADGQPMPVMLEPWTWEDVKGFFSTSVDRFMEGELGFPRMAELGDPDEGNEGPTRSSGPEL